MSDQALKTLGLAAGASSGEITAAYKQKLAAATAKGAAAPTPALAQKYEAMEAKLTNAYRALNKAGLKQSVTDSPKDQPKANPIARARSSSLSGTKLADLPGMTPADAAQVELTAGQVIANRYEIKERVGQGGMGAVYRAFDKNRDEDIAIKVLLPSLTKNENALERFLNEARVSSKLSHQHIVNVFDVQNEGELYFITMELLEGQDLAQLIATREQLSQPFSDKELVELLEQLAPALDYAHQHTVHRDIKPENIWLDEDGDYKLMDFGIAQIQSTSRRTQTGAAMGTAYYMAPEQLKGSKNITAKADIYALGVMLYAMATGDVPAGLIKSLDEKRSDISPAFSSAVMQCLESDPEDRPASATALLSNLQAGLTGRLGKKGKRSKSKAGVVGASTSNGLNSQGPNKLVIAAVVLVLLVGLGFLAQGGHLDFLKPIDKEAVAAAEAKAAKELATAKAGVAKLLGEIKNYQRRLDNGRRDLASEVRDAKRNNTSQEKYLYSWQQLTDNYLFEGTLITELEGEQAKGELLLRENSVAAAKQTLTAVRDGYKGAWDQFNAAEDLLNSEEESNAAESRWLKRKRDYDLDNPSQVPEAQQAENAANTSQREGDFAEALNHWQQATSHWDSAYKAVASEVGNIDKQRASNRAAQQARIANAKAAKAAKAKREALVKQFAGTLVKIPSGSFQMGSNSYDDEKPIHWVSVSSFTMQQHEVTWAQYQPCIDAGACPSASDRGWGKGNRPVIEVSWNDITQKYIPWLNKQTGKRFRLPSEAEWEYAARAGSSSEYSWGNSASSSRANYSDSGYSKTVAVKSYSPNAFGLYDMHGNVWEWVQDCWNASYSGAPSNGQAWQSGDCSRHVLRGGSWINNADYVRSAYRINNTAGNPLTIFGFRLVQDR